MANLTHLVLERDGHDQPWGFRLQGGADVGLPLSVQRVLVGTPSEGTLFKGDVIHKVSYTETKGLSHQQAADLFDNAGNQIHVYVKRTGGVAGPTAAAAPLVNGPVKSAPVSAPVSGGVPLPGIAAVSSVNCDLPDSTTPTPSAMSIQSQPHKYNPELGVGSVQHLRMQDDHITGVKEPSNMPSAHELAKQKANELIMKEKVTGSLQQISAQTQQTLQGVLPKGVVNKQYNTPLNLYSNDTIQDEVLKQASNQPDLPHVAPQPQGQFPAINPATRFSGLPGRTLPGAPATAAANPVTKKHIQTQIQRPQPVILTPNKEYNPQESATWKLLQEVEPKSEAQEEKIATFSSLKEHDPIYSEVYTNPTIKVPEPGQHPPPRTNIQKAKSPVADFLPFNKKQNGGPLPTGVNDVVDSVSPVRAAALSESAPINHQMTQEPVKIPVYETNSIGGRKKIAQSQSFNKLMMDVLGDQDDD